jgi:hypothetical protein
MKFFGDRRTRTLVWYNPNVIAWFSDNQTNLPRSRPAASLWPGTKSTIQITREDRNVATGYERTNPGFEFLELSSPRTCSFRKNDQNITSLRKKLTANSETLPDMGLAGKRQCINNYRRDPSARHALEKIIRRGRWKCAMQPADWQSCEQADRIEMTGMICNQDKGAITAEIFFPNNLEATISPEESANDQRNYRSQPIDEHIRFTGKIPEPFQQSMISFSTGCVLPFLHRSW